ncbi:MAG TPA: hypothetical protein VEX64_05240 [Pyrinomonadaceae bacterium]|nr:hypothetical protein [Pyrinomonadaceae bacterium]
MKDALEKSKIGNDDEIAPKVFGFAALGVMAATFALMGFQLTIIIFLALVGYFVWRAVSRTEMGEVRGIFEFYLAANEILRDDERRWYGFEIQDVINRGERVLHMMPDPPPLVHFALGALYNHAEIYNRADEHLSFIAEQEKADEKKLFSASSELRSYVRILRKLEREPAEAPQTMAAIRALERARRNRSAALLEDTRRKLKEIAAAPPKELPEQEKTEPQQPVKPLLERLSDIVNEQTDSNPKSSAPSKVGNDIKTTNGNGRPKQPASVVQPNAPNGAKTEPAKKTKIRAGKNEQQEHKSITEVLRDIYD